VEHRSTKEAEERLRLARETKKRWKKKGPVPESGKR
jgi:hypothetical protein